jgi:diguanylate cyclase (GGDEF)-like protein
VDRVFWLLTDPTDAGNALAWTWARGVAGLLPHGARLPPAEWERRHRAIVRFIGLCSVALALIAALQSSGEWHGLVESATPAVMAALAWWLPVSQRIRASLASAALMVIGVFVVHTFGTIEAHFLFFIMVPVVALYEDWAPFATSSGMVIVHHFLAGMSDPASFYNHQAAIDSPLLWSMIHSGLFLAVCVTSVVHWHIHEKARAGERALLQRLEQQTLRDPLTGLGNRKLLDECLGKALRTADEHGGHVAVLMADIDGFKHVNDTYGHASGDALLNEIGKRLRLSTRSGDTIARLGGDEFVVILPSTGTVDATRIAKRIITAVAAPALLGTNTVTVGASIGVAVSAKGQPATALMENADVALYVAKHSGRGRYVLFSADMDPEDSADTVSVNAADARDWAQYMRDLRGEIAAAKEAGGIPAPTRGPESARRTLDSLIASIDQLAATGGVAPLPLPERKAVEEFVFHHSLVHGWADALAAQGVLTVRRTAAADRFWSRLRAAVTGFYAPPADRAPQSGLVAPSTVIHSVPSG